MKLREHLIIGAAASLAIYPAWGLWRALLFWAAEVLIDADHYWDYLWRSKFEDWSPPRMFRFCNLISKRLRDQNLLGFSLLHTAEIFLLVFLLAHYWSFVFFITIFWGMVLHIFLDMIWLLNRKAFFVRAYSIIEYWIRKKTMIRRGLKPDDFYKEIFKLSK